VSSLPKGTPHVFRAENARNSEFYYVIAHDCRYVIAKDLLHLSELKLEMDQFAIEEAARESLRQACLK
jgi:hypothetical protein